MKGRNRDINIFSMSALDLFASALGAFILIAVVLFPYFPNTGSSAENIAELRAQLAQARQELQQCRDALNDAGEAQQQLQQCQSDLQQCQADREQSHRDLQQCTEQLRKKFLLVLISWGNRNDVDLHVVDPNGREFYYSKKTHPGTPAKLEEDNQNGPGNEIWLHPQATPGEYRVYYKLYAKRGSGSTQVRGALLTPDGRRPIPDRTLNREGEKPLVAIITVDSEGEASLRTQ